ncbi:FecR family protein [Chitinophaga sp. 30R24]|uniref:FecR family protein n=1 Tax=Chitinophaga sp. 30R24 TaxID=3248838 RepID=UPI003B9074D9
MSYYMGNKNKFLQHRQVNDEANDWYDQVQDEVPFDAFGNLENQMRIGHEIYTNIWQQIGHKKRVPFLYLKVAAALLVLLVSSIFAFRYITRPLSGKSRSEWTIVSAGPDEYKKITLPDSSVIKLHAASRIRFASAFNNMATRSIYLEEGAAFFEVSKNASRPFIVHTKGFSVKVLGTSFNISAYSQQPDFKVAVLSGKIMVEQQETSGQIKVLAAEMTQGQCLTVNLATTAYKIEETKPAAPPVDAPQPDIRSLTLSQIAKELGDKFNLFVQLNNPENDTTIYQVNFNQSLDDILTTLSAKTGFDYTIVKHQHLIINPKTL